MPTLRLSGLIAFPALVAVAASSHSFGSIALAILGIGFLIFIHELGHFLACKLTKTRVETFSIGFGPRLFGWERAPGGRRHFTLGERKMDVSTGSMDVRIAAVPLGGYVKMAGEIGGDGSPTSGAGGAPRVAKPDEFPAKPFAARVFIISAGVIMNALTAFVFFWIAYGAGLLEVPPVVGSVAPGGPAAIAGLRPGDRITSMGGKKVRTFTDFQSEIVYLGSAESEVGVLRDGKPLTLKLRPEYDAQVGFPRAQVTPVMAWTIKPPGAPVVRVGPNERVIVSGRAAIGGMAGADLVSDAFTSGMASVRLEFPEKPGASPVEVPLDPLRKPPAEGKTYRLGITDAPPLRVENVVADGPAAKAGLAVGDVLVLADGKPIARRAELGWLPSIEALSVERDGASRVVTLGAKDREAVGAFISSIAFQARSTRGDIRIAPLGGDLEGGRSPAGTVGLLPGDRLLEIDGKPVSTWDDVSAVGKTLSGTPVTLKVRHGDEPSRDLRVLPALVRDEKLTEDIFELEPPKEPVPVSGVLDAAGLAAGRTVDEIGNIFRLIKRFFTGEISFSKNIGGPVSITKMSSTSASEGWTRFLAFLAIISVNLCVLNILPIPVLDGGHLLFLIIERVRGGRPLEEGTIAKFQLVGFALLMLLMVFALKNDFGIGK